MAVEVELELKKVVLETKLPGGRRGQTWLSLAPAGGGAKADIFFISKILH
jgi:hypothetical protein